MRENQCKSILRRAMSFILVVALVLIAAVSAIKVEAATKPSIAKSMTIGTGSIYFYNPYSKKDLNVLAVSNPVKKATYSFSSSDSKVVKVTSKGTEAYLVGVKAGTATITCNQKLNGKTTKVGTCKVTVKDVKVYELNTDLPLGKSDAIVFDYSYRNCDAKYTYETGSKNLEVKDNVRKADGELYFVSQTINAKKAGTYTITAKETYNNKTRTIGKVKVKVHKASIEDKEFTMDIGDTRDPYYLISYFRYDVPYFFEVEDTSILKVSGKDRNVELAAIKEGTTKLNIYENATKADKKKLLGTCKITVKKVVLEGIEIDSYTNEAYIGEDDIYVYLYKKPYNAPGTFTVTSSDTAVATVSEPDENNTFNITPVGVGTTTITVTCEEFTETMTFTVKSEEDEYDEYEEDDDEEY